MVFEIFRRRQKQMLAGLVMLAMFAFIGGDVFSRYSNRDKEAQRDLVVGRIWGRDVRQSEVATLLKQRQGAIGFLMRAMEKVGVKYANRDKFDLLFNQGDMYDFYFNSAEEGGDFRRIVDQPLTGDSILRSIALVGKADRLGIVVTDEQVSRYISQVTGDKLTSEDFRNALNPPRTKSADRRDSVRTDEILSEAELFRALGRELKIRRVLDAISPWFDEASTPLTVFRKLEATQALLQLEMVRVPVEKFVDPKAEAANDELRAVYDKYKSLDPNPNNDVPGLRVPERMEAEFIIAQTDKAAAKIEIPDEEIRKYYDSHPSDFLEDAVPPPGKPLIAPEMQPRKPPAPPSAGAVTPKAAPLPSKPPTTVPPPPPTKPSAPATAKQNPPPPSKQAPPPSKETLAPKPADQAAPKQPAPPKKEEKPPTSPAKTDKSSDKKGARLFRALVQSAAATTIVFDDPKAAPKPAEKEQKKAAAPPPAKSVVKAPPPPQIEKKAPAPPPAKASVAPGVPTPPVKEGAKEAPKGVTAGELGREKAEQPLPTPKRKALAAVKNEIKRILQVSKAKEVLTAQLQKLIDVELVPYADQYLLDRRKFQTEKKTNDAETLKLFTPPKMKRSFAEIAKEEGFEYKSTGLVTSEQAQNLPVIGKFAQKLFSGARDASALSPEVKESEVYVPKRDNDISDEVFVVRWKTKEEPPAEPEFNTVRQRTLEIWRLEQARKPALKFADELAEKVRKAKGKFDDVLKGTGYSAFRPPPFTRATAGPQGRGRASPRDSLDDVPDAGRALLDAAFDMDQGEVRVAAGKNDANFYVLRLLERTEPGVNEAAAEYSQSVRPLPPKVRRARQERTFVATGEAVLDESGYTVSAVQSKSRSTTAAEPDRVSDSEESQ